MTDEPKIINPFENPEEAPPDPQQMLEALLGKAVDNNSLKSFAQAIRTVQQQLDGTFNHLQMHLTHYGQVIGRASLNADITRLTIGMVLDILKDKDLLTDEELDKLYKEKVVDVMEERRAQAMQEMQEEMGEGFQQEVDEAAGVTQEELAQDAIEAEASDVVLASEKAGEPKVFPADEEKETEDE
jgi:hypothetical protein